MYKLLKLMLGGAEKIKITGFSRNKNGGGRVAGNGPAPRCEPAMLRSSTVGCVARTVRGAKSFAMFTQRRAGIGDQHASFAESFFRSLLASASRPVRAVQMT
jgi:hypothetical protein